MSNYKVKVCSAIFILGFVCFVLIQDPDQVSVYRTIGPLVSQICLLSILSGVREPFSYTTKAISLCYLRYL